MFDENLCNERHVNIDKKLDSIESKLDLVIKHDAQIKTFWQCFSAFLVIVGLVIGVLKLLT